MHIGAMYVPGLGDTLRIEPVSFSEWAVLLPIASTLLLVMELEKWWDQRYAKRIVRAIN